MVPLNRIPIAPLRAVSRPAPALIDRLRVTLDEIDQSLAVRPDYPAAREFRKFLIGAIEDIRARQFDRTGRLDPAA